MSIIFYFISLYIFILTDYNRFVHVFSGTNSIMYLGYSGERLTIRDYGWARGAVPRMNSKLLTSVRLTRLPLKNI